MPIMDVCFGTACKILQAWVRSGVNGPKGLDQLPCPTVQIAGVQPPVPCDCGSARA
jgi:hypothetical protein